MTTTTLTKLFESMKAPRLAEIRCLGYLSLSSGDLARARSIAAKERTVLEESDWAAAIDYAEKHGFEVTNAKT